MKKTNHEKKLIPKLKYFIIKNIYISVQDLVYYVWVSLFGLGYCLDNYYSM